MNVRKIHLVAELDDDLWGFSDLEGSDTLLELLREDPIAVFDGLTQAHLDTPHVWADLGPYGTVQKCDPCGALRIVAAVLPSAGGRDDWVVFHDPKGAHK